MRNFKSAFKIFNAPGIALLIIAAALCMTMPAAAQQRSYSVDEELFYRINFGRADDVKTLLDKGANPNAVSNAREYALTVAIGRNDSEAKLIVKALLDKGANPNIYDKYNSYPIASAVVNNQTEIVGYLLDKGADYHVKTANGRTLVEVATANNNQDILKLIQDRYNKEEELAAYMRSPENFKNLTHQYVYASCVYQYWNFYLSSRQNTDKDDETTVRIEQVKTEVSNLVEQIRNYFPRTPSSELQRGSEEASEKIFNALDSMVSNRNRAAQGVGTDNDASTRCHKISDPVEIDFPGVLPKS